MAAAVEGLVRFGSCAPGTRQRGPEVDGRARSRRARQQLRDDRRRPRPRRRVAPRRAAAHGGRDRRAVGARAGAPPADAGRRPRRDRRARQPRHRQRRRVARRQRLRARAAADARLSAARPDLPRGADEPGRRAGAAAIDRGPVARHRPAGALRARPAEGEDDGQEPARQHRRRDRRAGRAGRRLQGHRPLHGARDLLDQAGRDPAGGRGRAEAAAGRRRHRAEERADRQGRPAARLQARHGRPARRGARRPRR